MLKTYSLTFGLTTALLLGCGAGTVGSTDSTDGENPGGFDPAFSTGSGPDGGVGTQQPGEVKPEQCNNQLDDDRDGQVDEGCACDPAVNEGKQECYTGLVATRGKGVCHVGTQRCLGDLEFKAWGRCTDEVTPRPEVCGDSLDNDCNGEVDDAALCKPGAGGGSTANPCKATPWDPNCWDAPGDNGDGPGDNGDGPGDDGDGPGDNGGPGDGGGNPTPTPSPTPTPTPLPVCDASNCSGCCTAQGICQQPTAEHCGTGGGACGTCSLTQQCAPARGTCEARRYRVVVVSASARRSSAADAWYNPFEWLVDGLIGDPDWYITAKLLGGQNELVLEGETGVDSDNHPRWNDEVFEATEDQLLNRWMQLAVGEEDSFLTFHDGKYGGCNQLISRAELAAGQVTIPRCGAMENLQLVLALIPIS
jgi:hypothetical protein